MLDSLSKSSISLYGETSNQIWGVFMKGVSIWLFPSMITWQIHSCIPTFWKYWTRTLASCFCISLVLESRSRRKTGQYIYCYEFKCRSWRGVRHYVIKFVSDLLRWFSPGTLVSFTNKANHHDITEILLNVAIKPTHQYI